MLLNAALLASLVASVSAHYTFPSISGAAGKTGDWEYVRRAGNWQNNGFVGNVASAEMRCFQSGAGQAASKTMSVAAGGTVTYNAAPNVYHPGPMSFYLARVPEGETASGGWTGDGAVWFKIYHEQPNFGGQLTWPSMSKSAFSVTVPACIPAGDYLLRAEHLGLHAASSPGGAQFYISCAQLSVTGGGSTDPPAAYKVAFPGAYKTADPGIQININYPVPTTYKNPGPDVFSC